MKGMSTFVPQDEDQKFTQKPYFYTYKILRKLKWKNSKFMI